MSEISQVIQRNEGYYWSISIEFKHYEETTQGQRYNNSKTSSYTLSGNCRQEGVAFDEVKRAREYIHDLHKGVIE